MRKHLLVGARSIIVLAVVWLTNGCGPSGPTVVPVSGVLTRGGQPVPNLEIFFMPTQGRNSVGHADEQGRFSMQYTADQDGALVGTHKVFVVFNPPQSGAERAAAPAELRPILDKYGTLDKTPLTLEITKRVSDLEIKLD